VQISGFSPSISASHHGPQPHRAGEVAHANNKATAEETKNNKTETSNNKETNANQGDKQNHQLSQDEKKVVQQLQARDREVRAHEAAHKAAGGGLIRGGASYSHQRGPDGKLYAIGGEVSIDTGAVSGDPQATLQKANQISSAALAPAQPSSADQAVAAAAAMMAAEARQAMAAERREEFESRETSKDDRTNEVETEAKQQPDKPGTAETRHYQAVANSDDATPPKLDLIA